MNYSIRRIFVGAAVTAALGAGGLAAPAAAHHSDLGCEPAVTAAAIDVAKADVRTAQKRFTSHNKSSMKTLVKKLKAREKSEAKKADKLADRLTAKATKLKGEERKVARAAAKDARKVARAEAKEAKRIQRASFAELRKIVKLDRKALKAQWNAAKATLKELKVHAETCAQAPAEPPAADGTVA